MIRKILKGVLRAAIAQPWDYMGEGAPADWEFRVAPDSEAVALYSPDRGKWLLFQEVVTLAEASVEEMDKYGRDWRQFLSVEDPEDD